MFAWLCAVLPTSVFAQDEPYVGTLIVVDAVSDVTIPIAVGIGGVFLGAPIVHLVHGHPVRAAASFAFRFGLIVGGGWLGRATAGNCRRGGDFCPAGGVISGAVVGLLAAQVMDYTLLSRIPDGAPPRPHVIPSLSLQPGGGVTLVVAGTF